MPSSRQEKDCIRAIWKIEKEILNEENKYDKFIFMTEERGKISPEERMSPLLGVNAKIICIESAAVLQIRVKDCTVLETLEQRSNQIADML